MNIDITLLNIIISSSIALIAIGVTVILFRIKRKDEWKQLREENRMKIRPLLKTNNAMSNGTIFETYFKVEENDATDFSIEVIECSKFDLNLRLQVSKTVSSGGSVTLIGSQRNIDRNVFSNYEYKYAIYFRDIERNRYKAIIEAKGMNAHIVQCKPVYTN